MLYLDPQHPVDARVTDLLGRMTLEEKVRQMGYADCAQFAKNGKFSAELAKKYFTSLGIGGLQDPRMAPKAAADCVNAIQKFLIKNTRLGIPALVASECLHGHMSVGATIFPQAIALASSWNIDLVKKVAATAARHFAKNEAQFAAIVDWDINDFRRRFLVKSLLNHRLTAKRQGKIDGASLAERIVKTDLGCQTAKNTRRNLENKAHIHMGATAPAVDEFPRRAIRLSKAQWMTVPLFV